MLSGETPRAAEMAGTAVLRIVVSSDSMKNATATSQGKRRLAASVGPDEDVGGITGPGVFIWRGLSEAIDYKHATHLCEMNSPAPTGQDRYRSACSNAQLSGGCLVLNGK